MKKLLLTLTVLTLALYLVACTGKEPSTESAPKDLADGSYTEMGDGTAHLSTPSGTSEDGNIPVIYASADTSLLQIGLNTSDLNGSNLSYIYVDGYLLEKEQLANSQAVLTLTPNQLTVGTHKVEIVQYENDDTTAAMITYKTCSYETKAK